MSLIRPFSMMEAASTKSSFKYFFQNSCFFLKSQNLFFMMASARSRISYKVNFYSAALYSYTKKLISFYLLYRMAPLSPPKVERSLYSPLCRYAWNSILSNSSFVIKWFSMNWWISMQTFSAEMGTSLSAISRDKLTKLEESWFGS